MVTAKNKKTNARSGSSASNRSRKPKKRAETSSKKVHVARAKFFRRSHLSERDRRIFLISRRVVFGIVVVAMLAVILAVLAAIFNNPEALVTGKIEKITADYYENYFYTRIEDYGTTDKSLAEIMERYVEAGFSRITLRQLLLFDSERYASSAAYITEYCDPETTYVKIYPEAPFTKSDYRVEYHYACTF